MTDRIEPALTPQEWRNVHGHPEHCLESEAHDAAAGVGSVHAVIALANAALPDDDPRKITRHHVWIVRTLAGHVDMQHPGGIQFRREALELANVLESYLPPE